MRQATDITIRKRGEVATEEILSVVRRIISLLSIPLVGVMIWMLVQQVRRESRLKLSTPVVGLVMAPLTLLVNIIFLHQAFSVFIGPALLILGLGFGLAWGQTARLYTRQNALMCKRSVMHLVFWGISYGLTQLLATFTTAVWVTGGLAAMFFSTGSTLGTNLNLLVRMLRERPALEYAEAENTRECPHCKNQTSVEKPFCTQCGKPLA
jgi:hypothetical protein